MTTGSKHHIDLALSFILLLWIIVVANNTFFTFRNRRSAAVRALRWRVFVALGKLFFDLVKFLSNVNFLIRDFILLFRRKLPIFFKFRISVKKLLGFLTFSLSLNTGCRSPYLINLIFLLNQERDFLDF